MTSWRMVRMPAPGQSKAEIDGGVFRGPWHVLKPSGELAALVFDDEFAGLAAKATAGPSAVVDSLPKEAAMVALIPREGVFEDRFCTELGFAIMVGKPILVICDPTRPLPAKVEKVADKVVRAPHNCAIAREFVVEEIRRFAEQCMKGGVGGF